MKYSLEVQSNGGRLSCISQCVVIYKTDAREYNNEDITELLRITMCNNPVN